MIHAAAPEWGQLAKRAGGPDSQTPPPLRGTSPKGEERYPRTPDDRYFVVRGRLWRLSNPALDPDTRQALVRELMAARRSRDRARVDAAKRALGERGPVWWDDGAPDWNRHLAKNTPYAAWYSTLPLSPGGSCDEVAEGFSPPGPNPSVTPSARHLP